MNNYVTLLGRLFMAFIFIMAGLNKIPEYAGTQAYMDMMGVSGSLLPLVIALEVGAGVALLIGAKTRYAALALAAFTLVAAFMFHNNFSDQMQMIMFMKNIAITGGLLFVFAFGAGEFSLDKKLNWDK